MSQCVMMIRLHQVVVFVCVFQYVFCGVCEDNLVQHFSSKTGYRFVENKYYKQFQEKGCKADKIWMLTRHGTRNPSEEFINVMKNRLKEIKNLIMSGDPDLINTDLQLFKKWDAKLDGDDEKKLTSEGGEEMIELSERMQARFPDILPPIYSNTSYQFKYTQTKRAKASAINFAIGLFGKKTARDVWYPEPSKQDPILRFYKLCNNWKKDVKKNASSLMELRKFKSSKAATNVVQKIEKRLNFQPNTLTFDDVMNMYSACAYETAWSRKKKSPWCTLFDLESVRVSEYAEDIKYYWIDGYGFNITYEQACPAFSDMFNFIEDNNTYPKARLYFTHSGTLLKMLAHLGLYKDDEPLRHDNFNENRKWRVSKIDPFGNNMAFVSFKCGGDKKVMLLHQERPVRFPACPDQDLCDLKKIKDYYSKSIESCSFNEMCGLNE